MPGKRLFTEPSAKTLIDLIPADGCLLIFNGKHRNFRSKAAETGCLRVHQFHINRNGEGRSPAVCDLYITWRE